MCVYVCVCVVMLCLFACTHARPRRRRDCKRGLPVCHPPFHRPRPTCQSGRGGESIYGEPFEDEPSDHLHHDKRGVLSMANSGKNSNKSQFFITFGPTPHLNRKHTVFGRVVGGGSVLDAMEEVEVR